LGRAAGFHFRVKKFRPDEIQFGGFFHLEPTGAPSVSQPSLSEGSALVPLPRPNFLSDPAEHLTWMIEADLQHRPEQYDHTNARPNWRLPMRVGLARKFITDHREHRITPTGLPAFEVKAAEEVLRIRIPHDAEVFETWLEDPDSNCQLLSNRPPRRFRRFETSDKGRYLQGAIDLWGGLSSADFFLRNPFWPRVFNELCGKIATDAERSSRIERVGTLIQETIQRNPAAIATPSGMKDLASNIARQLIVRESLPRSLTLPNIRQIFQQMLGEHMRLRRQDTFHPNERFEDQRGIELEMLLNSQVLFQGANLPCQNCGSSFWYPIGQLDREMRCQGCLSLFVCPPSPEWSFKLNELVLNCIKRHGIFPVLRTLTTLAWPISNMFLFRPSQNIYASNSEVEFTDLDIIAITDGRLIIGEVKSSPSSLAQEDCDHLQAIAMELEPNEVILAALGEEWPALQLGLIQSLSNVLTPRGIEVKPLLLSD